MGLVVVSLYGDNVGRVHSLPFSMPGQVPGTLALSQGFGAGKGAKGGPDWAETPPFCGQIKMSDQ